MLINNKKHMPILNFVDRNGNPIEPLDINAILNQEIHPIHSNYTQMSDPYEFLNPAYKGILSSKEKSVVYQMFSTDSALFRSDYKIKNLEGCMIWNKIVLSMPKCNRRYVYRYLNAYDKMDVQIGDILTIEHSLTATQMGRKFTIPNNYIGKYIIRCRSQNRTKAHDVSVLWNENYSIYKQGLQVNFEENSSFQIDKVIPVHGKPYIYMHEI